MVIGGGGGRIEWANVFDYRPQRSCGKVMFLHLSVILFTGGCLPQCMLRYTHPWADILRVDTPCPVHAGIHTFTPCPVHSGIHIPLPSACWDTPPLPSACWDTHGYCCGRYASYWNAFLFKCVFLHGWSSGHLSIRIVYKSTVNINTYDSELCLKYY